MPSRRALLAGVGATSVTLAGCNHVFRDEDDGPSRQVSADWTPDPGEWAGRAYDQANSGHNPHASPPRSEPTITWDVERGRGSILVADGTVFLKAAGALRAFDAEDGTEQFETSRPSIGLHSYVDGRLYDSTPGGIEALTLDGEAAWDDQIAYNGYFSGLVEREGYVFLSTGTDTIHHHDADTGERVDATVHDVGVGGLANRDGVMYAALTDGVVAYDVGDNGNLDEQWRHTVDEDDDHERWHVALGGERTCVLQRAGVPTTGTAISVFDTAAEEHVGTIEFDRSASASAIGEYTYVIVVRDNGRIPTDGEIHAYDGTERQWAVELEPAPVWLVLADGTLYVGSGMEDQRLIAIDAESGDGLWEYEGAFPQAVAGETVYATAEDDRLVALRSDAQ